MERGTSVNRRNIYLVPFKHQSQCLIYTPCIACRVCSSNNAGTPLAAVMTARWWWELLTVKVVVVIVVAMIMMPVVIFVLMDVNAREILLAEKVMMVMLAEVWEVEESDGRSEVMVLVVTEVIIMNMMLSVWYEGYYSCGNDTYYDRAGEISCFSAGGA